MTLPISRRSLLKGGLMAALLALLGSIAWWRRAGRNRPVAPLTESERAVLSACLDTFIPADDTPGALDLGLHHLLLERAGRNRYLRQRFRNGVAWLDAEAGRLAGRGFRQLSPPQREQVIARCEQAGPPTPEFKFYLRFRNEAFRLYYADPRSWPALCYQGPPQPRGFPDYQQPAVECDGHETA